MGSFVMKRVKDGYLFRLFVASGLVIGTSQIYISENACKKGIVSVMQNAQDAGFENQTLIQTAKVKVPNPKFILSGSDKSLFRFYLCGPRGEVILSSQGYATETLAVKGISLVRATAPEASGFEEGEDGILNPINLTPTVIDGELNTDVGEISIYTDRPLQVEDDDEKGGVLNPPAQSKEDGSPAEKENEKKEDKSVPTGKALYPNLFS